MRRLRMLPLLAALLLAAPAAAQQLPANAPKSLGMVPADVGFYSASLGFKKQIDAMVSSRAMKKLLASPYVQMGLQQLKSQWKDGELSQARMILEQPENKELLKLLEDGISRECYFYGDAVMAQQAMLANRISNVMNRARMESIASGSFDDELVAQRLMEFLLDNKQALRVPALVFGFQISSPQVAKRQIDRLAALAPLLADSPLAGQLGRSQVNGADVVTLNIEIGKLPLDDLENQMSDLSSQEAQDAGEKLMGIIKKTTVAVSVGLKGDQLLVSFGPSTAHLSKLGSGSPLGKRAEFQPLARHAKQDITSVGYVSAEFMDALVANAGQLDDVAEMVGFMMEMAPVAGDVKEAVQKDIAKLMADVKEMQPRGAATMGVEFSAPRGFESYAYTWPETKVADGSKPLKLLQHVGGDPLVFAIGRTLKQPGNPQLEQYWEGRLDYYVTKVIIPQMPPPQRDIAEKMYAKMKPLGARMKNVGRNMLGPGMTREGGVVLDAKLLSDLPHRAMPQPEKPLPLPEMAIVMGVADKGLLAKAVDELFSIADAAIAGAREVMPQIPPFEMPRPVPKQVGGNTVNVYEIPPIAGLDAAIGPNGGMNNEAAVMSMAPETTARLLNNTSPAGEFFAAYLDKPLSAAAFFDMRGSLQVVNQWVDYALVVTNPGDESVEIIADQVSVVMEVLGCLRSFSSVTYDEGEMQVTHSLVIVEDIP